MIWTVSPCKLYDQVEPSSIFCHPFRQSITAYLRLTYGNAHRRAAMIFQVVPSNNSALASLVHSPQHIVFNFLTVFVAIVASNLPEVAPVSFLHHSIRGNCMKALLVAQNMLGTVYKRFVRKEEGASLVEYGLLVGLI